MAQSHTAMEPSCPPANSHRLSALNDSAMMPSVPGSRVRIEPSWAARKVISPSTPAAACHRSSGENATA